MRCFCRSGSVCQSVCVGICMWVQMSEEARGIASHGAGALSVLFWFWGARAFFMKSSVCRWWGAGIRCLFLPLPSAICTRLGVRPGSFSTTKHLTWLSEMVTSTTPPPRGTSWWLYVLSSSVSIYRNIMVGSETSGGRKGLEKFPDWWLNWCHLNFEGKLPLS